MRPHQLNDVNFMVELNSDPDVTKYVGGERVTPEKAAQIVAGLIRQFEQKQMGRFVVIEKQTNELIGWCGLKWLEDRAVVDIGYRLLKRAWGRGIATEASVECLKYGFRKLNLDTIFAMAHAGNLASIQVLKKLGMKEIGRRHESGEDVIDFKIAKKGFVF